MLWVQFAIQDVINVGHTQRKERRIVVQMLFRAGSPEHDRINMRLDCNREVLRNAAQWVVSSWSNLCGDNFIVVLMLAIDDLRVRASTCISF